MLFLYKMPFSWCGINAHCTHIKHIKLLLSLYSDLPRWCNCRMVFLQLSRRALSLAFTVPHAKGAVDVQATK